VAARVAVSEDRYFVRTGLTQLARDKIVESIRELWTSRSSTRPVSTRLRPGVSKRRAIMFEVQPGPEGPTRVGAGRRRGPSNAAPIRRRAWDAADTLCATILRRTTAETLASLPAVRAAPLRERHGVGPYIRHRRKRSGVASFAIPAPTRSRAALAGDGTGEDTGDLDLRVRNCSTRQATWRGRGFTRNGRSWCAIGENDFPPAGNARGLVRMRRQIS